MTRLIPILGEMVAIIFVNKLFIRLGDILGLDTALGWFTLGFTAFPVAFGAASAAKAAFTALVDRITQGKSA
ncbi:MAG: hypothetical protein QM651_16950 [Rhodoblastus sp.]